MQPRIYTYKITFEEVPYYYYGSKKEKYYNQEYWGSPKTNRWCWELYTPKKQILELFDYTDEGYEECLSIENRLIKPFLNDPYCLNERCSNFYSLRILRDAGKKSSKKNNEIMRELNKGIFALTVEQRSENGKIGGKKAGEQNGKRNKEYKLGICGLTIDERKENVKITNSQKWMCVQTGYVSTAAGVVSYQKRRGIDTTNRIRIQ
jgi:hypothetical protein